MAQFSVNPQRFDPYKNFKFRVKWDGRYVAGISKVGALKRSTEVVEHREGGDPSTSRKSPGRSKFEAIMLERGTTHDIEFERWANRVWNFGARGWVRRRRSPISARISSSNSTTRRVSWRKHGGCSAAGRPNFSRSPISTRTPTRSRSRR